MKRVSRSVRVVGASLLFAVVAAGGPAAAAPTAPIEPPDPRLLDELAQDVARFSEAVKGYRQAATDVIKRAYVDKMRAIRAKYEPLISLNEKEEKERRLDAIAMFESFLRKYPNDRRWTPDAMFRLAELYYEKSSDEFLTAQEAYQKLLDSPSPPTTPSPKPDYNRTVDLYRRLLVEFPNYRLLDAAYYLLGFCLYEMGQEPEAKQALLALTCANRYKPLDPPPPPQPAAASASSRGPLQDLYKDCVPVKKESKFVPEAWTRVGEMHFDAAELGPAISAYGRVLQYKDSPYYDKALYKLAWAYYRDNRFVEAIKEFDGLVKFADEKKAAGDKLGSDLRPEAVQYLGISFAEPDWDGDTLPDTESGLQRAQTYYKGREEEPHVKEVFKRLADIYFDSTKYNEAIAVYKTILSKWPFFSEAPTIQNQIVRAYERDRNMIAAAKERETLGLSYAKGSEWWNRNKENSEALAVAQQLAEDALLIAATNVHMAAQACKDKALPARDLKKLEECSQQYRSAASLYQKYLAAYPNSKKAYEFGYYYADALYFGGAVAESIPAYAAIRDSILDNKHQEESARQIVKAYEDLIEKMKAERKIDEPPIPTEQNTKPPVTALAMPEVYQKFVEALDWYAANMKNERVPDMRYAAAVVYLKYRNWPDARARLGQLTDAYCAQKPELGIKAYDSLLVTYFIDYNIQDEELKDCALGRLLSIAEQFQESACAKSPKGAEHLARISQIRTSVKSTVITQRLKLALQNEQEGTNKQLTMCRESSGGIALVTGVKPAAGGGQPGAGGGKISTEIDEGLALDLIDLVNTNPKDADAAKNLNNACVTYQKLYKFGEATRCFERLAREYPDDKLARDATWNAARTHEQFFEFEQAVQGYLKIAQDPKFADFEHRREALGLAAILLDNDQQYTRAAEFYKKYADVVADKPKDSSDAFWNACTAYKKAKDMAKYNQCLNDIVRRYGTQQGAGDRVIEAYMEKAVLVEQTAKQRKDVLAAYQKVREEFISRRLPPGTDAAKAAAKAEYLMLDDKFKRFAAKQLTFYSDNKKNQKVFDTFTAEAKALQEEYARIFDYKDAMWTTAAFLKRGDIFYEFGQKLLKAAENPPDELKTLAKRACRLNPDDCGVVEASFKDAINGYVQPIEDEAKKQWKTTLENAAKLGVTNEYVKKARENLSKYDPEGFPFIKDEKVDYEYP